MRRSKKIQAILMAAAASTVVGYALPSSAATDTWIGTLTDVNHGTLSGVAVASGAYDWNTGTVDLNFTNSNAGTGTLTPGRYNTGDDVIFTDNFSGGKDIDITQAVLPKSMTFVHIAGSTPTTYNFHVTGDAITGGSGTLASSASPFGAAATAQTLTLDTGFNGTVILRAQAGLPGFVGSNTIVKSGTLELQETSPLPGSTTASRQNPALTLAGGQLNVDVNTRTNVAPGGSDLVGTLTVSNDSTLSLTGIGGTQTTTASARLWNGTINIASTATLFVTSASATQSIQLIGLLANSTGTMSLGSATTTVSLQNTSGVRGSNTLTFDLGTGTNTLTTSQTTATLGALTGGVNTTIVGSSGNNTTDTTNSVFSTITYSIGAKNISTQFDGRILNGTGTFAAAGASGAVSDLSAITKVGNGNFTLTNNNTYSGGTTVNSATLTLSGTNGALANTSAGTVNTINTASPFATLRLDNTVNNNNRLNDTATITLNKGNIEFVGNANTGSATSEIAGALRITGGINNIKATSVGSGTMASLTFASYTATSGIVNFDLDPNVNINFLAAPTLVPAGTGILQGATANSNNWATATGVSNTVAAYTNTVGETDPDPTTGWTSTQNVNLTTNPSGALSGSKTINSLRNTASSATVTIPTASGLTITSGGILAVGPNNLTIAGPGSLTSGVAGTPSSLAALVQDAGGTVTISAPIVDNGVGGTVSLVKSGPGVLVLSGVNSYTGGITLAQGTIKAGATGALGAGSLVINFGTTVDIGGFNQTFTSVQLVDGLLTNSGLSTATLSSASFAVQKGTINTNLVGAGALTKSNAIAGTNTVVLTGVNSYAGGTNVNGGTLDVSSNANALPANGAATLSNAGVLDIGAQNYTLGAVNLSGSATITGTTGTVVATSYLMGQGTVNVPLGGAGVALGATATGSGTLFLNANNTYTGVTTFGSGISVGSASIVRIVSLGNGSLASGIGAASSDAANLMFTGGSLSYEGPTTSTDRLFTIGLGVTSGLNNSGSGTLAFTNPGVLGGGGGALNLGGSTNNGTNTFAPVIAGGGTSLIKTGASTWQLLGSNTYDGATSLTGGTLVVTSLPHAGSTSSSIGLSDGGNAVNLTLSSGTFRFVGTDPGSGVITSLFTDNGTGGVTIDSSGTTPVQFTNTGDNQTSGNGNRTLTLGGSNTGDNFIAGTLNDTLAAVVSIAKTGAGQWTLKGAHNYTGSNTVTGGTLITATNFSSATAFPLVAGGTFTSLTVGTGSFAKVLPKANPSDINGVSVVPQITVTGTGQLDISNGGLVVEYNPTPAVTTPVTPATTSSLTYVGGLIKTGFAAGSWNGAGIVSSTAAADATHKTGLGYAEASSIGIVGSGSFVNSALMVDDTAVLVRYTYLGDADLNGKVDTADFSRLVSGFGTGTTWVQGDFNYDGVVNALDFNAIAANYGLALPTSAPILGALVPEPTTLGLIAVGGLFATRRRRSVR